jgi:tetratricopeptide (TPR) repeat protein/DNA-binding CsgD family transcriptional regulator
MKYAKRAADDPSLTLHNKLKRAESAINRKDYLLAETLSTEVLHAADALIEVKCIALCILAEAQIKFCRFDAATESLERALSFSDKTTDLAIQARVLNRSSYLESFRNRKVALEFAEKALRKAERSHDINEIWHALLYSGRWSYALSENSKAEEYLRRALQLAEEQQNPSFIATTLLHLGQFSEKISRHKESQDYLARAKQIAESIGEKQIVGQCFGTLGNIAIHLGDYPQAMDYYFADLEIGEALGETRSQLVSLTNIGMTYSLIGDPNRAMEYYARALSHAYRLQDKIVVGNIIGNISALHIELGDIPRSIEYGIHALEVFKETENQHGTATQLQILGAAYESNNNLDKSRECYSSGLNISKEIDNKMGVSACMHGLANLAYKAGDMEAAYTGYCEVYDYLHDVIQSRQGMTEVLADLGRFLLSQGKTVEAIQKYQEALQSADQLGERFGSVAIHQELANIYSSIGDRDREIIHLRSYLELKDEISSEDNRKQLESLHIQQAVSKKEHELQVQAIRTEHAEKELANNTTQLIAQTELLSEIRKTLTNIIRKIDPATPEVNELRDMLKNMPCKSVDWERFDTQFRAAHPEFSKKLIGAYPKLTPTEVRMCSLLRMNMRSAEIARLFCLSERTVEHHRAHIRKKMQMQTSDDLIKHLATM